MAKKGVFWLVDGRLLLLTESGPRIFANGAWIPAEDVTFDAATESVPVLDCEIGTLAEAGILPENEIT